MPEGSLSINRAAPYVIDTAVKAAATPAAFTCLLNIISFIVNFCCIVTVDKLVGLFTVATGNDRKRYNMLRRVKYAFALPTRSLSG